MRTQLIIEIDLSSSTGDPIQLEHKMNEIIESFRSTAEHERYYEFNRIVYNDWDDPHTCDLTITVREVKQ
jgi:hypothetical protein